MEHLLNKSHYIGFSNLRREYMVRVYLISCYIYALAELLEGKTMPWPAQPRGRKRIYTYV
jgi:hypothetical protein